MPVRIAIRKRHDSGGVLFHFVKFKFHDDGTTTYDTTQGDRPFAKATGFSRRRQVFCAPSMVSSALAVCSTKARARQTTGMSLAETQTRRASAAIQSMAWHHSGDKVSLSPDLPVSHIWRTTEDLGPHSLDEGNRLTVLVAEVPLAEEGPRTQSRFAGRQRSS